MADTSKPTLEMRVLGGFAVHCNGDEVQLPQSRKTRALLAYLAVSNHPQRRERLCEMFWDLPDDPRGALRWSLSKLRQIEALKEPGALSADRNTVTLHGHTIRLDLQIVKALSTRELASLDTAELESLTQLFRGEFLEDLSLPRCPKFEEWRISWINEANMLKARILRTLIARIESDATRALPHVRALQSMYPDDAPLDSLMQAVTQRAHMEARQSLPPEPSPRKDERGHDQSQIPSKPDAAPLRDVHFCTAKDGVRIAYSVTGEGLPLVKTPSWASSLQYDRESPIWRHWIEALTKRNRLIRYDERGHGLSDRQVSDFSFDALLADLENVVDAAQADRFVLLGVSHGCAVSIAYAAKHPERVSHLVLYGGCAEGWRVRADAKEVARREAVEVLMQDGWRNDNPLFRQLLTALFVPEATHPQIDWVTDHQRLTASPETAAHFSDVIANIDISAVLPKVRTPTLVLHARSDQVVPPECGRANAKGIPGARFVTLESRNHILLADEPAFAQLLDETWRFIAGEVAQQTVSSSVDRKRVTVLAIDIVNPLSAFASADPELELRQIDPLLETTFEIIERHGGVINASGDSSITAVFSAAETGDRHAVSACQAAVLIKSTLEHQAQESIRVRVGLDTGEVVIRDRRRGAMKQIEMTGGPLRTAVKLVQSLRRGVIALTERTRAAAGGSIEVAKLPRSDVIRFDRDEQAYEIKIAEASDRTD
jgi:pimeloyl-ACP methyl ester carboxylesterase/DNA-binding SARP family transcriptional activator